MLNVNQITHTLSMMADQDLQRFAATNKTDPYMLSLAVSESNRRKAMRQEAATPPAAQQPKVADQAVAGIAALPADNMQFADGGIVGFADGGQIASPGMLRYGAPYDGANVLPTTSKYAGMSIPEFAGALYDEYGRPLVAGAKKFFSYDPESTTAAYAQRGVKPEAGAGRGFVNPGMDAPMHARGPEPSPTMSPEAGPAAPVGLAGLLNAPGSVRSASSMAVRAPGGGGGAPAAPRAGLGAQAKALADAEEARLGSSQAKIDAAYAKVPGPETFDERRKLLDEDTTDRDTQTAQGMALLKAAAAMAKPGQTFLTSLVAGMSEGGAEYAASMKAIKAADRDRRKALAELAEAERAAKRGDAEKAAARVENAAQRMDAFKAKVMPVLVEAYKGDAELAHRVWSTQFTEDGQNRRAAAANATTLQAASMRADRDAAGSAADTLKALQLQQKDLAAQLTAAQKDAYTPQGIAAIKQIKAQQAAVTAQIAKLTGAADTTSVVGGSPPVSSAGWGSMSVK